MSESLLRFRDLKARGIINNWVTLKRGSTLATFPPAYISAQALVSGVSPRSRRGSTPDRLDDELTVLDMRRSWSARRSRAPSAMAAVRTLASSTERPSSPPAEVLAIRRAPPPYSLVAETFGISQQTCCDIRKRRSWALI